MYIYSNYCVSVLHTFILSHTWEESNPK